jgi:hypothetical protein
MRARDRDRESVQEGERRRIMKNIKVGIDLASLKGAGAELGVGANLNKDCAHQNSGRREWKWECIHHVRPLFVVGANPGWVNS